jgi:trk system potassium uptake protein
MRVAVAGAGDTGQSIARALLHSGHQVLLIERYRAAYRPSRVPDAEWMFADACELAALQAAGIDTCDAVIAASGDDKVNLVFASLCKTEFAVPRVVARINKLTNRELFTADWGVDVAVASPDSLLAAAEQQVAPGSAVRLLTLHAHTSLIELTVAPGSPADGRPFAELQVPADAAFLAVIRDRRLAPPASETPLLAGDQVLVLASPDAEPLVRTLLERVPDPRAEPDL